MTRRTDRIGAELLSELARILREEVADPRVRMVTLTRVDVSPDLRNAIVFYSTFSKDGDESVEELAEGLDSAASFLRRRAARALPFKRMPELRFRYDPSLALGQETLGLLREISEDGEHDETEPT